MSFDFWGSQIHGGQAREVGVYRDRRILRTLGNRGPRAWDFMGFLCKRLAKIYFLDTGPDILEKRQKIGIGYWNLIFVTWLLLIGILNLNLILDSWLMVNG